MFNPVRFSALLVLTLVGCGGAATPAAPASSTAAQPAPASAAAPAAAASGAATKLVVGLGQAVPQVSPVWVAQDAGIFARNNLDVDAKVAVATVGMAALLAGELNFQIGGGSELLNATANGAELVALANLTPKSALRFMVGSGIRTKEDLVGKKVGVTRIGSATHSAARALLTKIGLDPDKDVSFVQLETPPIVTAALIAGQVQGGMCNPPDCFRAEAAGMRAMYVLTDLNMADTTAIVEATKPWLNSHRSETQRFIDGVVQGIAREKQDKALSVAALKKNMKIEDDAAAAATYDIYAGSLLASEPFARAEHFVDVVSVITAQTGKMKDFDVNTIINNSFVQSAIDRGLAKA